MNPGLVLRRSMLLGLRMETRRTSRSQRWEMSILVMGVSRGVGFRSASPQLHRPDYEHGTHLGSSSDLLTQNVWWQGPRICILTNTLKF